MSPRNLRQRKMFDKPTALDAYALLRMSSLRAKTGLSRSEIYRRIAAGDFPKPIKLGQRASAWPEHEVTAWIAARIAQRDSAQKGEE